MVFFKLLRAHRTCASAAAFPAPRSAWRMAGSAFAWLSTLQALNNSGFPRLKLSQNPKRFRARLPGLANPGRLASLPDRRETLGHPPILAHRILLVSLLPSYSKPKTGDVLLHSTTSKFCANGHSPSIHCSSHRNPVRSAICTTSVGRYLCELSVQIVSPSLSIIRKFAAGTATRCLRVDRKCISIRRSSSLHRASCRKHDKSKSAPSSRLIRASKFKLNAAVTPAGSLYASNCVATSFSKSVPSNKV